MDARVMIEPANVSILIGVRVQLDARKRPAHLRGQLEGSTGTVIVDVAI